MSTTNTFNLLLDDDNEDPSQLIAAQIKVVPAVKKAPVSAQAAQPTKPALLPTKPLPPAQAVRDARNGGPRGGGAGGGRGGGRGYGRRGGREGGFSNDNINNENSLSTGTVGAPTVFKPFEEADSGRPRGGYVVGGSRGRGGYGARRGGFENGDAEGGERPRRNYERRSGTGRGNEVKRDGSGRGNWGSPTEDVVPETEEAVNEAEKTVETEKPEQEQTEDPAKENPEKEAEVKEPEPEEDKEMTLEEYQKVLEEKRKALLALKTEERKVPVDKEFASMQLLSGKKAEPEIFVKLGSDKDIKRKEVAEKEERAKKSVSINEFLKPAEGEAYYGRGRGRGGRRGGGRGGSGGYGGGNRWDGAAELAAPLIDDTNFPSLGGK
ncbi:RGG repeats nuclear RNA binding protein A-like [Impatiens glandulifera]|uniref:RGG repeats nuclear RNA binding protein A-like n=1 Tax=Impatiens glandulifera TaxID=253017 RepID=UPI001FB191F0|nr:RGG repeats nuclear RNA binding protein A-like [Impatiens glandulifera]